MRDFTLPLSHIHEIAQQEAVPLWPDGVPDDTPVPDFDTLDNRGETICCRRIANVHRPTLTVYRPDPRQASGAGVVICPGGGYGILAIDKEGHEIGRWLQSLGVLGLVLTYRLARGENYVHGHHAPLQDAQRAIRLARSRSAEWGLDAKRIGIMGFSAGAHLAASAGTLFHDPAPGPVGCAEGDCRPDFLILVYPVISFVDSFRHAGCTRNLLGEAPSSELLERYSANRRVTAETPPAFLAHTCDDSVSVEHTFRFIEALRAAKVPAEAHIYGQGGHGYGLRHRDTPVASWPLRCEEWLRHMGHTRA